MEDENPTPAPSDTNDLQAQYLWLRKQVLILLVLLIVVSGTLNIFLWRQLRYTQSDLAALQKQAEPMIAEYQQSMGPRMDDFVKKITEYGRTHPDFAPIMAKYQLGGTSAPPATAPPKK